MKFMMTLLTVSAALTSASAFAQNASPVREESASVCGRGFFVEGDIQHFKTPKDLKIEGATHPKMYEEEVYGKSFSAGVEGLPEGEYTVQIFLMEPYVRSAGARVMDIFAEGKPFAEGVDIFAAAGFGKELIVSGTVRHAADAINGPLRLSFKATRENAKFNAIRIMDAAGGTVACVSAADLQSLADIRSLKVPDIAEPPIYFDATRPLAVRIDDLARRMSLHEKVAQLMNSAPAIPRLKVPAYDYWNECLHGVARAGYATVFPQAIGLAAMWDEPLMLAIADTIATEGRAKANASINQFRDTRQYDGLTYWTPNINIFRDPRWGRGQETYGEDPFLTGRLGVAFVRGLQGGDSRYMKAMACAKHFAVHSGPEASRHSFDARPPERDLFETYLPQFEMVVREAQPGQVMSTYNALNGIPTAADPWLLTKLLREEWGYKGLVVSDCGAIGDIHSGHHYTKNREESASAAVKAGNDLNCGGTYRALTQAVFDGLITERQIDTALKRVLEARFKLGMFDPPDYAYAKIPPSALDTPEHRVPAHEALALKAARQSVVLLKNDGILPLTVSAVKRIAVIGDNAASRQILHGNYHGEAVAPVNILDGIKAEFPGAQITRHKGVPLALREGEIADAAERQRALDAAKDADIVIYVGGLSPSLEGEEMPTPFTGFSGGDRVVIELPAVQEQFLRDLFAVNPRLIFVNCSGSALALAWEAEQLPAIVQAWYPGEQGGVAVAEILSGKTNPSGRLPVTFYAATKDLPGFEDYSMANRTYRYFTGKPLFAFGHGLSYTKFEYAKPTADSQQITAGGEVTLTVAVTNSGARDGDEVVQVYAVPQGNPSLALKTLVGFRRVSLKAGESQTVSVSVPAARLRYWDTAAKRYQVAPGVYEFYLAGSSAADRQRVAVEVR